MSRLSVLAVALLATGLACGDEKGVAGDIGTYGDTVAGICTAASQAAEDPAAAKASFERAHEELHAFAKALEGVDRGAAAEVLVAKQEVEEAIASDPPSTDLPARLDALSDATLAGAGKLSQSTVTCP